MLSPSINYVGKPAISVPNKPVIRWVNPINVLWHGSCFAHEINLRIGNGMQMTAELEALNVQLTDKLRAFENLQVIHLEPTQGCNLRCRMCHVTFEKTKPKYLNIDDIDWDFCRRKVVKIGAVYEPLIHPQINKLIEELNRVDAEIVLITNGHNLNKKEIPALSESKIREVTFSFDGVTKKTYEEIRQGGNYLQTLSNIEAFLDQHAASGARFAINMTVMKSNLAEVPLAPLFWEGFGVTALRFIGMVARDTDNYVVENNLWDCRDDYFSALDDALDCVKSNRLNIGVSSPYYRQRYPDDCPDGIFTNHLSNIDWRSPHNMYEYSEITPIVNKCISPFTAVTINCDGLVNLCQRIPIGSLYEHSFDDLWCSENADALRREVVLNHEVCNTCDYFKFCIKSSYIDVSSPDNYISEHLRQRLIASSS